MYTWFYGHWEELLLPGASKNERPRMSVHFIKIKILIFTKFVAKITTYLNIMKFSILNLKGTLSILNLLGSFLSLSKPYLHE